MEHPFSMLEVLGVPVAKLAPPDALQQVARVHDEETPAFVAYANAHTLNLAWTDSSYRDVLKRAAIVLNDGSGIALAARIQGDRFPANLNGSDFNPQILGLAAERGWRVYFLGARPGVAERAANVMKHRYAALQVVGCRDGYWKPDEAAQVVDAIRVTGASLIMAALGNPLQEKWLDEHLAATGARLGVAVGAFLDFAAGEVPRAPAWMNRWGIEWIFRLAQEPGRLWRRYVLGNPLFLGRVVRERLKGN